MYITRTIENLIVEAGKSFPCVVVYGPRQVGKSTTIDHIFGDKFKSVTLDDLEDRALAQENPRLFLESYGTPLVIDEIQKVPTLLDEIKKNADEMRLKCMKSGEPRELMYVLTGSNRFELQQGISESLAGRCGIVEMNSFSRAEVYCEQAQPFTTDWKTLCAREAQKTQKTPTKAEVFEDIFQGGMPDICTGVARRDIFYKSYLETYIEKDVRKLIGATEELTFRTFLTILAMRTAQELHYEDIAGTVGIDVRTVKRWISVLESSGLIFLLQPYMANISNRVIKAPKIYFMDTGLCAYLCKWPSATMIETCAMAGAFFETYVVSELVKNLTAFGKEPKEYIFYYRDIDQKEIDIIYMENGALHPIEIKQSSSPKKPTKNFGALAKYNMPIGTGLVIDTCDRLRPIDDSAFFMPVNLI